MTHVLNGVRRDGPLFYGCKDQPVKDFYLAQDGWDTTINEDGTIVRIARWVKVETLPSAWKCRFDKRPDDAMCINCTRVWDFDYLKEQHLL